MTRAGRAAAAMVITGAMTFVAVVGAVAPATARAASDASTKKYTGKAAVHVSHATVADRSTATEQSGRIKLKVAQAKKKTVRASSATAGPWRFYTKQAILGESPLVLGADGDIWLAHLTAIQRITSKGAVTTYTSRAITNASNPIAGPGGDLWFSSNNEIQRISASGVVTTYDLPCDCYPPSFLSVGPGGDVWWSNTGAFGRLAPDGRYTTFQDSDFAFECFATGSDGALWFTADNTYVGRMTAAGKVTVYKAPGSLNGICSLAAGPDAAIWFNAYQGSKNVIGRMSSAGTVTTYTDRFFNYGISVVALGPDKSIWFNPFKQYGALALGRITANGKFAIYLDAKKIDSPAWLAPGPDRKVWFTTNVTDQLGVFKVPS